MRKTKDLFKKIRDTNGTFHSKMGTIKDRNSMNLTEAEDCKKRYSFVFCVPSFDFLQHEANRSLLKQLNKLAILFILSFTTFLPFLIISIFLRFYEAKANCHVQNLHVLILPHCLFEAERYFLLAIFNNWISTVSRWKC